MRPEFTRPEPTHIQITVEPFIDAPECSSPRVGIKRITAAVVTEDENRRVIDPQHKSLGSKLAHVDAARAAGTEMDASTFRGRVFRDDLQSHAAGLFHMPRQFLRRINHDTRRALRCDDDGHCLAIAHESDVRPQREIEQQKGKSNAGKHGR